MERLSVLPMGVFYGEFILSFIIGIHFFKLIDIVIGYERVYLKKWENGR